MCSKLNGGSFRSSFSPASSSRWWAGIFSNIALILALFLQSWPSSGQTGKPTPQIGSGDYQQFRDNCLTVKLELLASKEAWTRALNEKEIISQKLEAAEILYDSLLASATQHSIDSAKSLENALQEVKTLSAQLKESKSSVNELRRDLESKQAEYDQALEKAQDTAEALEAENRILKWACGILATLAGAGAVYGGGHLLGAW